MRRFNEALLFAAWIFFFLSFTNGLQTGLLPAVKRNVLRKDGVIPGLLNKRQLFCTTGFLCDDSVCCPIIDEEDRLRFVFFVAVFVTGLLWH